ncbi:HD domain-containing protein [Paenibacillus thiaminolyticus]|uniref:HD domain-containing protein n=1 Tax=Paenibacillus thiaminolyticus TaxID=49283 RepID=UPI0035A713F6
MASMKDRLEMHVEFIKEVDKLKSVFRQSYLLDRSRHENDAEHTWHLTVMAILLHEYANERNLNLLRVLKMLIIHDIVEIDAGDTFAYDAQGHEDKFARESKAAKRLFGILPEEQKNEMMQLWMEFEQRQTPEAQYAAALDRLQPLIHNYTTEGKSWQEHGVTSDRVLARIGGIKEGSQQLGRFAEKLAQQAVERGYLAK